MTVQPKHLHEATDALNAAIEVIDALYPALVEATRAELERVQNATHKVRTLTAMLGQVRR